MEALPSSSGATVVSPQSASAATGRVSRGTHGLPAFAQVVQEALSRTANSSAAQQPAVPSSVSASSNTPVKAKTPHQSGSDQAQAQDTPSGVSAVNTVLLPFLLLTLPATDQNQPGQTSGSPLGNITADNGGVESGMTIAGPVTNSGPPESAAVSGDRASKENGSSPATASTVLVEQIQAQLSDVLSAPLSSPLAAASSGDAPLTRGSATPNPQTVSDAAGGPAGDPQPKAPTLGDPQLKAPTLHEPELAPAVGDPLSSLLSHGAQLQHTNAGTQALAPPADDAPTQAGSQSQQHGETQQVGKSTLAPLPVLGTEPPVITHSTSIPTGSAPTIDEAHATALVQVPSSSSSGHGGAQDASANHKEPTRPEATPAVNVSPPASATHEATGGSQSLAAGVPVKQDGAQVSATAATVVPGPPVATFDRAAGVVATPHQNAPAAAPAPLPSLENADVAANHFVNNAKLVEAAGHTEMRIAMETDRLGAVELRAHMVGDEVGAAITVEKKDAHAILAVELPALQQALSDKQLRIEQVTLLHGSLSSATGDASASTKHEERSAPHAASRPWAADAGRISSMFGGGEQSGIFDSKGRLSVHA